VGLLARYLRLTTICVPGGSNALLCRVICCAGRAPSSQLESREFLLQRAPHRRTPQPYPALSSSHAALYICDLAAAVWQPLCAGGA
ncbi:hypothetical protein C8J57DRAFT_1318302, partial [Mycena rebaudengoi]